MNHEMNDILSTIDELLADTEMPDEDKLSLKTYLRMSVYEKMDLSNTKEKLEILFTYEKNYLDLIKDYKEEIKFASTLQEDLRKERAKFFSETLKDVSNTLKESQVEDEVASIWLKELVNSYTKSLDVSAGLTEENTLNMVGKIRKDAKSKVKSAS